MPSGVGSDEPMEDNKSASGRAKNNRIEIDFHSHCASGGLRPPYGTPLLRSRAGAAEPRLRGAGTRFASLALAAPGWKLGERLKSGVNHGLILMGRLFFAWGDVLRSRLVSLSLD
jgi:hypothetical protein